MKTNDETPHEYYVPMNTLLRRFGQKISQISATWVYVYRGEGADDEAAEILLHGLRHWLDPITYNFGYITPESIREGSWKNQTALLALGGGYDLGFINALGDDGMRHIKDYVTHDGGAYLGICAGAYFACDHIEFDKGGPLEVVGERQFKFFPGCCKGPTFPGFDYKSHQGAVASKVLYQSSPGESVMLNLYFNGGGTFIPPCDSFTPLKNGFIHNSISSSVPEGADVSVCHEISSADDTVMRPDRIELTQNLINLNVHNNFQQQLEDSDLKHVHGKFSSSSLQPNNDRIHKNHPSHCSFICSNSCLCCDEIDKLKENLKNKQNKVIFGEEQNIKLESLIKESHSSLRHDLELEVFCKENDESRHKLTELKRNYEILGCYAELAQQPTCIVKCDVGNGTALLSSVHFEYSFCNLDPGDEYLIDIIPKLKGSETQRQALFLSVLNKLSLRTITNKACQ